MSMRFLFSLLLALVVIAPHATLAADQYAWKGDYQCQGIINTYSGGPFNDQASCQADFQSKVGACLAQTSGCNCGTTVAAQGNYCPGFTTSTTKAPAVPLNPNSDSAPIVGTPQSQQTTNAAVPDTPQFVSLSNIPALGLDQNSIPSLPIFLNDLYKICIGIAVVIAVLQLIRGGITYMLVDSVTTKEQARHSITAAILGLILVLSPYIVFSVINPKILSLQVDVSQLQTGATANPQDTSTQTNGQALTSNLQQGDSLIQCAADTCDAATTQCSNTPGGGSSDHVCRNPQTGAITDTSAASGYQCEQGSYNYIKCTPLVKQSKACTGATKDTCPALQCASGTSQNYECVNASTGAQVSGNSGNLSCASGYTLTVQCR